MAYGLKYYFVDKKLVGSTSTTYTFEILEDGFSGSSTEWRGIDIQRQYEELSFRQVTNIQKSSCVGAVRVIDGTQRSALETIAGSEIGDYKVQLKRDGTVIWTGLVVPDLTIIGEENYGNQSAEIVAKDLFFTGDYPLTTLIPDTRGIEKAIVLIADILDTLGYGLDIVSYTSWIENNLTQSDDILNQSYHEKERFRIYGQTEGEDDRPLTNQQALLYILRSYGLILRQVNGAWNLIQVTAFENPASVRRYVYNSSGTQTSSSTSYSLGSSAVSDELYVLGRSANNYFAGTKKVKSKFEHESIIQGIKFNREYWIDDATEIEKSQYWQADGTGNLELSFTTWFAKTTDTDLGNPVVMTVSIYVDTGGTDYYWNGSSWVTSPATIDVEVQETYSTTDSDGNYLHKNTGINIVTDAIPDPADGTLYVKLTPDGAQPDYAYWYLRDLVFDLKYSDTVEGISSAILYELEQTGSYSDEYDVGVYYFGDGPTSASLSALKDSSRALLSQWKRAGDASTTNHQNLILNEIMNVRRNQRRNIRATLYGEYEPDDVLSYDSTSFFFLGGSWNSRSYLWNCNFVELNIEEATDTLTAFYITDGSGTSSGAVGSSGGSTGTSSLYLEKGKNLSDVPTPATARTNLGLGSGDSPTFAGLTVNGSITVTGNVDGRDISNDGTNLDTILATGVQDLASQQVDQLKNIDITTTIDATQWGYLGALDQSLTTTSDVNFDDVTLSGILRTNEIDAQADLIWSTSTEVFSTSDYYVNNAVNIGSNVYITDELDVAEDVRIGNSLTVSGSAILSSNTTIGGSLTLSGSADFNSTMNLQGNLTTQADLADDGFSEGWAGTNWKINADGSAEFEEMRIRGALRVYEFIAKQISTIGGSEILSIAQGRVSSVDVGADVITVENVTGTPGNAFKANDLWICQVVDINNDLESGGTGSIVKSVRGTVDYVSGNDIGVFIDAGDISELEQGDLIIAYGNTSDADRQAIMYRNVDRSEDNLIMRLQTEVNSFADLQAVTNTRVAFGDLNGYSGLSAETFGFFAGKNAEQHVLVTDTGIFFKNGSTVGAQLSSNIFKIGDDDNFLSFNTSNDTAQIKIDNFELTTGDPTTLIRLDSSFERTNSNITSSVTYSDTLTFAGLFFDSDNYLGHITDVDTSANSGYLFRVGGATTNFIEVNEAGSIAKIVFDTFDLDSTNLAIDSANSSVTIGSSGFLEDSSQNYRLNGDGLKINTYGLSSKGNIGINGSIAFGQYTAGYALEDYGSYIGSYNNGGTISKQDSTLYLYGTRAVHLDSDEGIIILDNLPTSASGLPSGAVYNDSGTLKIV